MDRRQLLRTLGLTGGAASLARLVEGRPQPAPASPRVVVASPSFLLPYMPDGWNVNPPAFNAIVNNNANGMAQGYVIHCPKAGTLDKVEFRMAASGSGATNGLRVSFQTVTAGFPNNVQSQYRDVPSGSLVDQSWVVPGLMTSDGTDAGAKRTVAAGELIGIVIEYVSFVAGNNFQIGQINYSPLVDEGHAGLIGLVTRNTAGGAWSFRNGLGFTMGLKYADGSYARYTNPRYYPYADCSSVTYHSGSTPDEYAIRFKLPYGARVCGFWLRANCGTAAGQAVLYDAANAVVASATLPQYSQKLGTYLAIPEVTLDPGVVYRLSLKPTSTTAVTLYYFQVQTAALLDATAEGIEFYQSTRVDGGAWTDTPTKRPWLGLAINGIDVPAAGGLCGTAIVVAER